MAANPHVPQPDTDTRCVIDQPLPVDKSFVRVAHAPDPYRPYLGYALAVATLDERNFLGRFTSFLETARIGG
jgi:hypothetical protein